MNTNNDNENYEIFVEKFSDATIFPNHLIDCIRDMQDLAIYCYIKMASSEKAISALEISEHFNIPEKKVYASLNRLMELDVIARSK